MEDQLSNNAVAKELGLVLGENEFAINKKILVEEVNHLIITDLEKLVSILYRMDVSEKKINELLKTYANEDSAEIIVGLMLEREAEKIKTRQQFRQRDNDIDEEEKW